MRMRPGDGKRASSRRKSANPQHRCFMTLSSTRAAGQSGLETARNAQVAQMKTISLVVVVAVLLGVGSSLLADDAGWQVGLARRSITPQQPVFMAGYASRSRPHDAVESELFVKALELKDADGKQAVLITSDLIGYRRGAAEIICERIQKQTGLQRVDILLNSSHTHTGPSLLLDAEDRSDSMSLQQAKVQINWTGQLIEQSVGAAVEALQNLKPASISYGVGVAPFVMNRREWTERGVILGVNPAGYADRAVPTLRIDAPDGTLRALVFGAAAHNTTLGGQHYFICGDYAGFAQEHIENEHPGVQAMFVLGCAGSANPYPRGSLEISHEHGRVLGEEVCRVLEEELAAIGGPLGDQL
jgi:neutral ceramidase